MDERQRKRPGESTQIIAGEGAGEELLRIAHMFSPYRDNDLMRDLCRLAIKCAQEGIARV